MRVPEFLVGCFTTLRGGKKRHDKQCGSHDPSSKPWSHTKVSDNELANLCSGARGPVRGSHPRKVHLVTQDMGDGKTDHSPCGSHMEGNTPRKRYDFERGRTSQQ